MSNDRPDFVLTQGDRLPTLGAVALDATGSPVNLANATSLTFRLVSLDRQQVVASGSAVADADQTANPGLFTYSWAAGDTNTPGEYFGELQAVFQGKQETFPSDPAHPFLVLIVEGPA